MNIIISPEIFQLQARGGISTLWRNLIPRIQALLPECTFDSTQPADVWIPTYYAAAPVGIPSIVTVFDWMHERYPKLSPFAVEAVTKRRAIAHATELISISHWTASDTQAFMQRESTVVYPATDLQRASSDEVAAFRTKYKLPDEYILIMGNRGLYKNVSTYWQATRLFNAPLTVCIGGENEPDSSQVRHFQLTPDDLSAAYTGALCLVYPSLYEGFGLPVLETYACGCPVVCGNGGALAEINSAAAVVDITKPMDIIQGIARVIDPPQRVEHILKGYSVAKQFSWDKAAQQYAAVIRRVIEGVTVWSAEID
jgi:glycosyltransferase involved in cell wall biosynthesis